MSVFGVIQFECGKIRARITPNIDTFHAVSDVKNVLTISLNDLIMPVIAFFGNSHPTTYPTLNCNFGEIITLTAIIVRDIKNNLCKMEQQGFFL